MKSYASGTVPSLEECLAAASDTEAMLVSEGALDGLPESLDRAFSGASAFIVADENTYAAAGARAVATLRDAGTPVAGEFVFPGSPRLHADYRHVAEIVAEMKRSGVEALVPVSVGAGTVNDLVKRASMEISRPYLCVPTAASVDGYTSYGAALLSGGYKQTLPCPAPTVVIADSSILSHAPAYLSSSGFGDLASKIVAGTDWIIAATAARGGAPGTEPIDPFAWDMTQTGLVAALEESVGAARGDPAAVASLFRALALTGFSMQYLKSSRPVSGCEHLFSHVWEMADLSVDGVPVTHGHKVAVGTLAATAITEALFSRADPPPIRRRPGIAEREAEARAAFAGLPALGSVVSTVKDKFLDEDARSALLAHLSDKWKELREEVLDRLLPYEKLRSMLDRAGCPTRGEDIGLSRAEVIATARKAQMLRNRYTALDLAWDFGILEDVLGAIETNATYLR